MNPSRASAENAPASLDSLLKLQKEGNYKDAYDGLRKFVFAKESASRDLPKAYDAAITCLRQLNRVDEIDAFREQAVKTHPTDWRLLSAVGQSYLAVEHYGYMIGGEFHRGQHRGGGRVAHATARDRVRALQLFNAARKQAESIDNKAEAADVLRRLASALLYGNEAWRMQVLTDLDKLPDYEEGWGYSSPSQGAPVDAQGNPIFYSAPKTWNAATSDGERWRWALETMVEWDPALRNEERSIRAKVLISQFGVETLARFGIELPSPAESSEDKSTNKSGIWALDTLGEDETIARLATGVKRFKLPDEHNFIKLYQQIVGDSAGKGSSDLELQTRCGAWRNSSRIAASFRGRPNIGSRRWNARRAMRGRHASSGWTRSSATGGNSKR